MDDALLDVVLQRLDAQPLREEVVDLVLAACQGDEALERALSGESPSRPQRRSPAGEVARPVGAFLSSITVAGFRGIGPQRVLDLHPAPGLTVVVGRNGSGKSSFGEALEVLLTGSAHRFDVTQAQVFRDGWRNSHHPQGSRVMAELHVAGCPGTTVVERSWPDAGGLADSEVWVQVAAEKRSPGLGRLGWSDALTTYKPFLAHGELEAMFGKPSELHDRLSAVLGLEELNEAQHRFAGQRKRLEHLTTTATSERGSLLAELGSLEDDRAEACRTALSRKAPDLDQVQAIVTGAAVQPSAELELLRCLASLAVPAAASVADECAFLREAADGLMAVEGTEAERARSLAELLAVALQYHEDHSDDADCPVCGRPGALDVTWASMSTEAVERLRGEAEAADSARALARSAVTRTAPLLRPPPSELGRARSVGLDAEGLASSWQRLSSFPPVDPTDPEALRALAEHLEGLVSEVEAACEEVRRSAALEVSAREDRWAPLAERVAAWLERGRQAAAAEPTISDVKAAEKWLKGAHDDIRNDRLLPIAERAQSTWQQLRHESNVDLGAIRLTGSATRRQVDMHVRVDGVAGSALGVMSQGEVNALALSLFLPRVTLAESPFRFVVVDDPVQAMDPAKVEGLARVFEDVARTHQVIVFSHDDRLPAAIRRLGIGARILEVQRRPGSVVEIVKGEEPATRALQDALAVARDEQAPPEVLRRVVPGLCRLGLEACLTSIAERRLLRSGASFDELESALLSAERLTQKAALAMFGDAYAGEQVLGRLNQIHRRHADTFQALNKGSHGELTGDAKETVQAARALVEALTATFS